DTLLIGAIAAAVGDPVFAWLATQGPHVEALTVAISAENFFGGFAGTGLTAYMSSLTSKAFTATQYALFSSFYALPGKLLGGLSGFLVDWFASHRHAFEPWLPVLGALPDQVVGFVPFFITTALAGLPALMLLILV